MAGLPLPSSVFLLPNSNKKLNESVLLSVPSSPTMRVDETPTILYSSHGGYIPNLLESKNFSQSNFRLVNYMDSMR